MKRRKGVTVFAALTISFTILAAAAYVIIMMMLKKMDLPSEAQPIKDAFDIVAANKSILAAFTKFDASNLGNVLVFAYIGMFVIVAIIWLIIGLRRGRKICIFFLIVFLCSLYVDLIFNVTVLPLENIITKYSKEQPLVLIPLGGALLGALASLFGIILFIVDMATGRVEKQVATTFIKEPTEEIEEGTFEEVKDESEIIEPLQDEDTPVLSVEEPIEEEVEEEPVKKPSAPRKVKKPEPKKAQPKKAVPAKKAEPKKEDARKTQTIILTNEEGNNYAKAYHVSRRPELNKWQVKATGSDKALKLFNTQKEAIEYADQLAKNQNVTVRVHSKEGKIRKHNG